MLVNPSFTGMSEFATTGNKIEPGAALLSSGFIPQEILPAEHFNWLMNRASKGVIEGETYIDNINKELNALLVNLATAPNSGATQISDKTVSTATINTIMKRDSAGRAKVVAPSASDDIAILSTVTTHAELTAAGTHGSAVAATINTLVHRDSAGRAQIVSPSVDADIANKSYVDTYVPAGVTLPFAGASVPTGWLLCNGSAVSRTAYSRLFSAIGTTWGGGDGSTTFNLPDMREAAPVGAGTFSAVTGTTHVAITSHDAFNLGQFKDDQMQEHWHNLQATVSGTVGTQPVSASNFIASSAADMGGRYMWHPTAGTVNTVSVRNAITDGTNGTPRTGTTTRTKQIGINYIIRY